MTYIDAKVSQWGFEYMYLTHTLTQTKYFKAVLLTVYFYKCTLCFKHDDFSVTMYVKVTFVSVSCKCTSTPKFCDEYGVFKIFFYSNMLINLSLRYFCTATW